jgi:hypothetical protein
MCFALDETTSRLQLADGPPSRSMTCKSSLRWWREGKDGRQRRSQAGWSDARIGYPGFDSHGCSGVGTGTYTSGKAVANLLGEQKLLPLLSVALSCMLVLACYS